MASRDPNRPNVIVILTDDQGCWAMGCAGNKELRTPNLDRMAAAGLRFRNFFCASPVCSPARASLLTGRIPSQHGVHDWLAAGNGPTDRLPIEPIEYLADMSGYTDILSANGYVCGLSGKWHLGDSLRPQKGMTWWEAHATGGGPYYGAPMVRDGQLYKEPRYVTDVIADNALAFIDEQHASDRPFYLSVHFTAPHSPWGREHHPADLYDDYHDNCAFGSVPDRLAPPAWAEKLSIPVKDAATRRAHLSGYYAAVTAMDAGVGRILDRLEQAGLSGNTLLLFTSDNGMNMGHHGVFGKGNATFPMNMFEESVKVPALICRPGHVPRGAVRDELLSHYDFRPTLLDYLGLADPDAGDLPGRSFAPLLRGQDVAGRDEVVIFDEYGPVRMVRTRDWKYVHRCPYGPHELYNLEVDTGEAENLYGRAGTQETLASLKARLDAWYARYAHPARDGAREPVTGRGQQRLAGPGGKGLPAFAQWD